MLIAHYPLNGDIKDYSGHGRDLIVNRGTLSFANEGIVDKSIDIATTGLRYPCATNGDTEFNDAFRNDALTISFWWKQRTCKQPWADLLNKGIRIIEHGADNNSGVARGSGYYVVHYNKPSTPTIAATVFIDSIPSVPINAWFHITILKTKTNVQVWINGKLDRLSNFNYPLGYDDSDLVIGLDALTDNMNDLRIFDHALSLQEVKEIYQTKILHYNFNNAYEEPTENLMPQAVRECSGGVSPHYSAVIVSNFTYGGYKCFKVTTTNNAYINDGFITSQTANCVEGKTYTFSLWALVPNGRTVSVMMRAIAGGGGGFEKSITGNSTWKYIESTFTANANTSGMIQGFQSTGLPSDAFSFYIRDLQLEEKDHATLFISGTRQGVVRDCSGFQNDGTAELKTSPSWTKESKLGRYSLSVKNATLESQFIQVKDNTSNMLNNGVFTVSLWAYKTAWSTADKDDWFLRSEGSKITVNLGLNAGGTLQFAVFLPSNKIYQARTMTNFSSGWHHFVGTFDNTNAKLYVDGILKTTVSTAETYTFFTRNSLKIGGSNCNSKIDDVQLYATALTPEDIKSLYEIRHKIDKSGNLSTGELLENSNLIDYVQNDIRVNKNVGMQPWSQCTCSIINNTEIYYHRNPNVIVSTAGNVTAIVSSLSIPNGMIKTNRKYKVCWKARGISDGLMQAPYLAFSASWTTNGVGLVANNSVGDAGVPSNFNETQYQERSAILDTTGWSPWQQAKNDYETIKTGDWFNCANKLAFTFNHTNTGTNGTDVYLTDFRLYDITDNPSAGFDKKGKAIASEFVENNFKPTLLNYSLWSTLGTGSIGMFTAYGVNERMLDYNPYGQLDYVWRGTAAGEYPDGGWLTEPTQVPINSSKKYRFTTWIKNIDLTAGTLYFGCGNKRVADLATSTTQANPYFTSASASEYKQYGWTLWVYYILPYDTTQTTKETSSGIYKSNGSKVYAGGSDYKWLQTTIGAEQKILLVDGNEGSHAEWYRPRIEICDGSEPSIETLLKCAEHVPMYSIGKSTVGIANISKSNKIIATKFKER